MSLPDYEDIGLEEIGDGNSAYLIPEYDDDLGKYVVMEVYYN